MAMFTITGTIEGSRRTISWDEGFSGDAEALDRVSFLMADPPLEVKLTANGPRVAASDQPTVAAYATARAVFDTAASIEVFGDVPVFDAADADDQPGTIY